MGKCKISRIKDEVYQFINERSESTLWLNLLTTYELLQFYKSSNEVAIVFYTYKIYLPYIAHTTQGLQIAYLELFKFIEI